MLKKTKKKNIRYVEKLKAAPQRFLITILIGNNLVNIGASVLTTVWVSERFGAQWLSLAAGALTLLVLIFGEIIPKNFAQIHAEKFALVTAPWILLLQKILFPLVWTLNKFSEKAVVLVGGRPNSPSAVTEEELVAMVSISEESGSIKKVEKDMINSVLELDDTRVESIMRPQSEIVSISQEETLEKAILVFTKTHHSRLPVYGDSPFDYIGVLHIRDCLKFKQFHSGDSPLKELKLFKPLYVPETKRVNTLFREFQTKRIHLAIVVDEHGTVTGLVSIEDILEEVFGEIEDEHDKLIKEVALKKLGENNWHAQGDISLKVLRTDVGEMFPKFRGSRTLAHALLEHFQKIPIPGDSLEFGDYEYVVEKMGKNHIELVKIIRLVTPEPEEPEE